ncbi:MAG: hypothetical protein GKR88_16525 [Flavobacteriaceae bacterium]|nr:MAG: hypothetical protein GKR88_16525 [Flavobacteriaceae bacterium]
MFGIKNKFKIQSDDTFGNNYVTVTSDDIAGYIETIHKNDIKNIVIKTYEGYNLNDIKWLESCPFIEIVHLFCYEDNFELEGLHYLENLRVLNLNVTAKRASQILDFSYFKNLENCSIDWNPKMKNLFNCITIKRLYLRKYKVKNLEGISNLINLKELLINNSSIENLEGMEMLDIEKIELSRLRKLASLKGLESLRNNLRTLEIESCTKLDDLAYLSHLSRLEKLGINDCKEIKSLLPIKDLSNLKWLDFWGSTKIFDGDMTPCLGIGKVAFENRKHYNYTNEEIDRLNQK